MKNAAEKKKAIINIINSMETEDLIVLNNNYIDAVRAYDDQIFEMDMLDDVCDGHDAYWLACRVYYGEFNPNDDYFKFDGYGNLESLDDCGVREAICADEIADYCIEKNDHLFDDDIIDILLEE